MATARWAHLRVTVAGFVVMASAVGACGADETADTSAVVSMTAPAASGITATTMTPTTASSTTPPSVTTSTTTTTTTLPTLDVLADYLVATLEAGGPTLDAADVFLAATTLEQVASAAREVAAVYDQYAGTLARLEPPPDAADYHRLLLEMSSGWADWFREQASAVEAQDSPRQDALVQEMLALTQQELELAEEQQRLVSLVLSEHEERPLNAYLLQSDAIRVPFTQEYQSLLEEMQWVLTVGDMDGLFTILEDELGLLRAFSEQWDVLTPPPEAAAFHDLQAEFNSGAVDSLEGMLAAIEDEDLAALQATLLRFMELAGRMGEFGALRTDLLINAFTG